MARETGEYSSTARLIMDAIKSDTQWDKNTRKIVRWYVKNDNTLGLSFFKALVGYTKGDLSRAKKAKTVDIQRDVEGQCICGIDVSSVYKVRIGKNEFFVGGDHYYNDFQWLFSGSGFKKPEEISKTIKKAKKERRKELEELVTELSSETKSQLERAGINVEQIVRINELIKYSNMPLTEQKLLYELDPGKKNSFTNWFREGIKYGTITDKKIIIIYDKLENAPNLIAKEELAKLVAYSYEHRQFETKAVIGGLKDDLLYLTGLKGDDKLAKLVKEYEPKGIKLGKRIIKKLEQPYMTFLEALKIKQHFPAIEKIRIEANREFTNRYGVGRTMDYLLKEVGYIFKKLKKEFAEDFKKYGEVMYKRILKDEYGIIKDFKIRSEVIGGTERENYLRMFPIEKFRDIAPVIVSVGRKVRFAREIYKKLKNRLLERELIKEEYMPKEDFRENFEKLTGIKIEDEKIEPDKVIDMIINASFVKDKNFLNFQKENREMLREMYKNKLMAKKYLEPTGKNDECDLKRYYNILKKKGITEIDGTIKNMLEKIIGYAKLHFIEYGKAFSRNLDEIKNIYKNAIKWVPKSNIDSITKIYSNFKSLFSRIGYKADKASKEDILKYQENVRKLKEMGEIVCIDKSKEYFFKAKKLNVIKYNTELMIKREGEISVYDIKEVGAALNYLNQKSLVRVNKENFLRKLGELNYVCIYPIETSDTLFTTKEFKNKVEQLYKNLQNQNSEK